MQKITFSKKLSIQFKISRNQAENLIKNKKVTLNGNIETRPFISVTDKDIFEIEKLKSDKLNIILFHKPRGCITSKKDEKDRKIVYDFLPKKYHQYHYIGRLDYNSEGLLLFTKETSFKRYMELPKSNIKRSYLVSVMGTFDQNKLKSMNKKIYGKEIYKKPNVKLVHSNTNKHVLRFNLTEGKNREIRNICALFNLKVEKLKRISYGRFLLKSITYGEYKEVEVNESYQR